MTEGSEGEKPGCDHRLTTKGGSREQGAQAWREEGWVTQIRRWEHRHGGRKAEHTDQNEC